MTSTEKAIIIAKITALLDAELTVTDIESVAPTDEDQPIEMLTLAECAETVKGLSRSTIRKLVIRGEIPSLRTGEGKRGKILVSKAALMEYINNLKKSA